MDPYLSMDRIRDYNWPTYITHWKLLCPLLGYTIVYVVSDCLKKLMLPNFGFQTQINFNFKTKQHDVGPILVNLSQNWLFLDICLCAIFKTCKISRRNSIISASRPLLLRLKLRPQTEGNTIYEYPLSIPYIRKISLYYKKSNLFSPPPSNIMSSV